MSRLFTALAALLLLGSAASAQNQMTTNPAGISTATFASLSATVASPSTQTSTGGVMMGLTQTITPLVTGRLFYTITGDLNNGTSNDGALIQCRHGIGTVPSAGGALVGTTDSTTPKFVNAASTTEKVPFACQGVITGAQPGTAIWIDLSVAAITGGTVTPADVTVVAHEY